MGDLRIIEHRLPLPASAALVAPSTFCADWQQEVRCPVCGFDYVHLQACVPLPGNGTNKAAPVAELTFLGECGHTFAVQFIAHKGQLFVRLEERIADRLPHATDDRRGRHE